jgi:hypothetical protein
VNPGRAFIEECASFPNAAPPAATDSLGTGKSAWRASAPRELPKAAGTQSGFLSQWAEQAYAFNGATTFGATKRYVWFAGKLLFECQDCAGSYSQTNANAVFQDRVGTNRAAHRPHFVDNAILVPQDRRHHLHFSKTGFSLRVRRLSWFSAAFLSCPTGSFAVLHAPTFTAYRTAGSIENGIRMTSRMNGHHASASDAKRLAASIWVYPRRLIDKGMDSKTRHFLRRFSGDNFNNLLENGCRARPDLREAVHATRILSRRLETFPVRRRADPREIRTCGAQSTRLA